MACKCAPALIVARNELDALFPGRDKSSDGCCPSPEHTQQNPTSDHEPNAQGWSRAYDFDESVAPGVSPLTPLIAHFLKDPRTKYVIYEGVLYYPDGSTRKNKGHDKHEHLSIHDWAVNDTRPWGIAAAFNNEEFSVAQFDEIIKRLDAIDKRLAVVDRLVSDIHPDADAARVAAEKALAELAKD